MNDAQRSPIRGFLINWPNSSFIFYQLRNGIKIPKSLSKAFKFTLKLFSQPYCSCIISWFNRNFRVLSNYLRSKILQRKKDRLWSRISVAFISFALFFWEFVSILKCQLFQLSLKFLWAKFSVVALKSEFHFDEISTKIVFNFLKKF